MNLSRRSFLGGVLAVTAAPVLVKLIDLSILPVIRGDGVHDDWAGLQAFLDGESFICENNELMAENGILHRGNFLLGRTLVIGRRPGFTLMTNHFMASPAKEFIGEDVIQVMPDAEVHMLSTYIEGNGKTTGLRFMGRFDRPYTTYSEGNLVIGGHSA